MLKLERLFAAEITLAQPQELGETPLGRRRIIGITGGQFNGARLSYRHGPSEVLEKLAAGEAVA